MHDPLSIASKFSPSGCGVCTKEPESLAEIQRMDLSRWDVFDGARDYINNARLAYTWGSAKGGYLVTSNDDVYCVGEHKYGQRKRKILLPKKMDALCGQGIKSFHFANFSTLAVTNSGKMYQWSISDGIQPTLVTGIVPEDVSITQVAVGLIHILALTSEGKIFSWGSNSCGQLGLGNSVQDPNRPQHVSLHQKILSVACSEGASFALTDEGDVLSWGRGKQNGRSSSDLDSPDVLLRSKSVSQIVGGQLQGLALTEDGKLYCWGMEDGHQKTPREICRDIIPIAEIAGSCHNEFFVCRTASQEIFIWGKWFERTQKVPVQTKYKSMDEAFSCYKVPTMWRTVTLQLSSHSNLLKSFESALHDEETSDIEFLVDGKKIFAHRICLKFRVPYFQTMFDNRWKDSNQRVIEVEKFTYNVFSSFITYVYTGKVEVKAFADLYGLLEAADYYNVQELLEKCENSLKRGVHEGNVCTIYALAVRHNAKNLQSYTREYIIPRLSKVVESKDFWEMDNLLSKQLIGEVTYKRKLVDASKDRSMQKKTRDCSNGYQQEPDEGKRFVIVDGDESSDSSEESSVDED